jgi:endonuclease/exonuclease/phosphatase (EEP) superfamily protein YafD
VACAAIRSGHVSMEVADRGRRPWHLRLEERTIIIALVLVQTTVIVVFLGSIAGFMGGVHHYAELASHFKLQCLMAALASLLICLALHAWWSALCAFATACLNLAVVVPWYLPPPQAPLNQPYSPVKLLFANVQSTNTHFAEFIGLVSEETPDVVIIQEATERWIAHLRVLEERFPNIKALPRPGGVGIALYSRIPVERFEVMALGSERMPGLLAQLHLGGGRLSVVTVHPRPPLRRHSFRHRNEQLRDAASMVQALPAPKILVGDFNTSLWSPYYAQLIRQTSLVNARQGFGLLPTWPAFMSWRLLMIPIDHCMVSPEIRVTRMRTGRTIGSDHLPIIVDMDIPGYLRQS